MADKKKGPFQKQKANVYTMMLICSFLALALGCFLLYKELQRYKNDIKAEEYKTSSMRPVAAEIWLEKA